MTMMSVFWFLLGSSVAVLHLASQWWTVKHLRPAQPNQAQTLILGGAAARWLLTAGLFLLAIQGGLKSLSFVFAGLWSVRWLGVCWLEHRSQL